MNLLRECFVGVVLLLCSAFHAAGQGYDAQLDEDRKTVAAAHLPTRGQGLLGVFRKFIPTEAEQQRLDTWVRQLGDENYRTREEASAALIQAGPMALAALAESVQGSDEEQVRRAERCIREIETTAWVSIVSAGVRLVHAERPAGASETLIGFLPYVTEPGLADEIYETLGELALPDEPTRAVFSQALTSALPAQRAAAALVFGRHGNTSQRSEVRQLLADVDSQVRLRAAQGLLPAGERNVVDVLVGLLLAEAGVARRAEDLLAHIADGEAPAILLGLDRKSRQLAHDAWLEWWQARRDNIDVAAAVARSDASPISQARLLSRRMLAALAAGDVAQIKQVVDVPFSVSDVSLQKWSDVEQFFHQALDEFRRNNGRIAFRVIDVVGVDDYLKNARETVRSFHALPKQTIRVVYIRGQFGGPREESGALLVRVSGQPRIIGLGPGEHVAENAPR